MSICIHVVSRAKDVTRLLEGIFNLARGEQGCSSSVLEKTKSGRGKKGSESNILPLAYIRCRNVGVGICGSRQQRCRKS